MKLIPILFAATMYFTTAVHAADEHPGMAVHEENCTNCHIGNHDEAFYTRADRKIDSYQGLQSMVKMCDAQLGTKLFDEDMTDIGNYLNKSYYKFPEK